MNDINAFTVRDLPLQERPRERLRKLGAEALSAQELLAVVLGRGVPGQSVMSVAQDLVTKFGCIKGLSEASLEEMIMIKGVGPARAVQLKAVFELGRRQELESETPFDKYDITDPGSVVKAIRSSIREKAKEHFKLIILNTRNKILAIANISTGTLGATLVHPREVFRDAIQRNASSVILVHNHPSGDPNPSDEDLKITTRLANAGKILGIDILDHIIIGRESFCSLREKGVM